MALTTILLVVLILALLGALPTWSHSRSWGYGPSGGGGSESGPSGGSTGMFRASGVMDI